MLAEFLIFYAPFPVLIACIAAAFWVSMKDESVEK